MCSLTGLLFLPVGADVTVTIIWLQISPLIFCCLTPQGPFPARIMMWANTNSHLRQSYLLQLCKLKIQWIDTGTRFCFNCILLSLLIWMECPDPVLHWYSVYAHFKDPCCGLNPGVLLLIYGIWSFHFLKYLVGNLNDLRTKLCQRAYVIAAFVVSSSPKVHWRFLCVIHKTFVCTVLFMEKRRYSPPHERHVEIL